MTIGGIYTDWRGLKKARTAYRSALRTYRNMQLPAEIGLAQAKLGLVDLLDGQVSAAKAWLDTAMQTLSGCECPTEAAIADEIMGRVLLALHKNIPAADHFEDALRLARAMGRPEMVWRAEAGLGDVCVAMSNLQEARDHYLEAVQAIESVRRTSLDPGFHDSYMHDKNAVFTALIRLLLELNDKYAALQNLERRNRWKASRYFSRMEFESRTRQMSSEQGRALSAKVALFEGRLREATRNGKSSANDVKDMQEKLTLSKSRYGNFLSDLEGRDSILSNHMDPKPLDIAGLIGSLPDDVAVISYFMDRRDLHVFTLMRGSVQSRSVQGVRESIREATEQLRATVARPPAMHGGKGNRAAFNEASGELHRLLIAPLGNKVLEKPQWYLLPDEELWSVAFGALSASTGQQRRYLAEDHLIVLVNTLTQIRGQGRDLPGRTAVRVAAFGDPEAQLPASREEVGLLRRIDPAALVVSGEAATEARVRQTAGNVNVLVFSAHAGRPPQAGEAYISLAPTKGKASDTDGQLTAAEIRGLNLGHVDLVVISACGTALNQEGDRVFLSLADAFLFAGAGSVLGSLWDISDRGTLEFVDKFVGHWKQTGSPSQGFLAAQRSCIGEQTDALTRISSLTRGRYGEVPLQEATARDGAVMDVSHPYYWGPFVLLRYGLPEWQRAGQGGESR